MSDPFEPKSKRISELDKKTDLSGLELIPISSDNKTSAASVNDVIRLVSKDKVGLGNVDNTSDLDKPISRDTQSALNEKANRLHSHGLDDIPDISQTLADKADKDHTHELTDVVNLNIALSQKTDNSAHLTLKERVDGIETDLSGFVRTGALDW